jgi:hypothetical protein
MTHEQLLECIVTDPAIYHGKPCIRGHRIWVSLIVDLLADGMTTEEILNDCLPSTNTVTYRETRRDTFRMLSR